MPEDLSAIAEAFSRKARQYDLFGRDHPNLERIRLYIRTRVAFHLGPGARLLEINAGTGADAAYFAAHGWQVLATDISPGMVAEIEKKAACLDLDDRLLVRQISFTELDRLGEMGGFDGLLSNMGGLNCIGDLHQVTRHFPLLLNPGAVATLVVMPPVCPWEWLAILKGDFRTAIRRLRPGGVKANVEGVHFDAYYFSPQRVLDALGERFALLELRSLCLFTPPADHKYFAIRYPNLYRWLVALDKITTPHQPFNRWGDFYMLSAIFLG